MFNFLLQNPFVPDPNDDLPDENEQADKDDSQHRKPRRKGKKIRAEKSGKYKMEELLALVAPHPSRTRKNIRRAVRRSEMILDSDSENEKKKEEGIPSMWDYDRRCMPREFIGLAPETFLVELPTDPPPPPGLLDRAFEMFCLPAVPPVVPPRVSHLCLMPQEILIEICQHLLPLDFVNLSLTCRFLHWRMFTFCRCNAPNTVLMEIGCMGLEAGLKHYKILPKTILDTNLVFFVLLPNCLKKPFFFETMELELRLPLKNFEECSEFVQMWRKYVNRLKVFYIVSGLDSLESFLSLTVFLEDVNASFYRPWISPYPVNFPNDTISLDMSIYWNSWTWKKYWMDEAWAPNLRYDVNVSENYNNRIGYYGEPSLNGFKRTVKRFFYSTTLNLTFHAYFNMPDDDEIIEYIFKRWEWGVEYYSEKYGHKWGTLFTDSDEDSNGVDIRMRIYKKDGKATVLMGREKGFHKRAREYRRFLRTVERDPTEDDSDDEEADEPEQEWEMETAIESEEMETTIEPEEKKKTFYFF